MGQVSAKCCTHIKVFNSYNSMRKVLLLSSPFCRLRNWDMNRLSKLLQITLLLHGRADTKPWQSDSRAQAIIDCAVMMQNVSYNIWLKLKLCLNAKKYNKRIILRDIAGVGGCVPTGVERVVDMFGELVGQKSLLRINESCTRPWMKGNTVDCQTCYS